MSICLFSYKWFKLSSILHYFEFECSNHWTWTMNVVDSLESPWNSDGDNWTFCSVCLYVYCFKGNQLTAYVETLTVIIMHTVSFLCIWNKQKIRRSLCLTFFQFDFLFFFFALSWKCCVVHIEQDILMFGICLEGRGKSFLFWLWRSFRQTSIYYIDWRMLEFHSTDKEHTPGDRDFDELCPIVVLIKIKDQKNRTFRISRIFRQHLNFRVLVTPFKSTLRKKEKTAYYNLTKFHQIRICHPG